MSSPRMRLVLIILSLLFPVPQSFVIRKRSVAYDFANDKESSPADWILERSENTMRNPYSSDPRRYELDRERLAMDLLYRHPESGYDGTDNMDEEDEEGEEEREEEDGSEVMGKNGMRPIQENGENQYNEMEDGVEAKPLDKSELENLFGEKEKKSVENVQAKEGESSKSRLTKEDVERLLNPESKGEVRKVVTETKIVVSASNGSDATPEYKGVRVVEVAEKDAMGGTRRQKETQWLMTPGKEEALTKASDLPAASDDLEDLGRGWFGDMLDEVEDGGRIKRKVKRSELSTTEEDLNDEEGPSETDRDVELLKAYIKLQTEENQHLENALNLAITTQVENSDEYLGDEIGHLRMAVEDEEALETIRKAIKSRQAAEGDADDDEDVHGNEEEEQEEEEQREQEEKEISKKLLKAKLKKFLIDSAVNDLSRTDYDDEDAEEEEYPAIQLSENNGKVLNPFTRDVLSEYRNLKRSEGFKDFVEPADEDSPMPATNDLVLTDLLGSPGGSELDYCPAVRDLTDGCLAARQQGLVLDREANELCNRHRICYYCGSVFGMSSDTCDRGYLGESELLCSGKEKCTKEALGLYLIMMKSHQYIQSPEFAPYICTSSCVYDYIVGSPEADRLR